MAHLHSFQVAQRPTRTHLGSPRVLGCRCFLIHIGHELCQRGASARPLPKPLRTRALTASAMVAVDVGREARRRSSEALLSKRSGSYNQKPVDTSRVRE